MNNTCKKTLKKSVYNNCCNNDSDCDGNSKNDNDNDNDSDKL